MKTKGEDDLKKWQSTLNEVKEGKKPYESDVTFKCFGGLEINVEAVQNKVLSKFEQLLSEMFTIFGKTLAEKMKFFKETIVKARRDLEKLDLNSNDVTKNVTDITRMELKAADWEKELERHKAGSKLLYQNRFNKNKVLQKQAQFDSRSARTGGQDWSKDVSTDLIESEWSMF